MLTGLQAGSSYDLTAAAHDASSAPVAATAGSYTFSSDGGGGGGAATAPPAQPSIDEPRTVVGASNVTVGGVSGGGGGTGVALWTVVAVPTEGEREGRGGRETANCLALLCEQPCFVTISASL